MKLNYTPFSSTPTPCGAAPRRITYRPDNHPIRPISLIRPDVMAEGAVPARDDGGEGGDAQDGEEGG